MQKKVRKEILVIDNLVRTQMEILDRHVDNFFSDTISLIMNFAPYLQKVVFGRYTRTLEHRIILVRRGSTTRNISFDNYRWVL